MIELFNNLSEDQVWNYGLVLLSSGITHTVKKNESDWQIIINDENLEIEAIEIITKYLEENQNVSSDEYASLEYNKTSTGYLISVFLLLSYAGVYLINKKYQYNHEFGSSAFHIMHGELYRSVTSLMLHADILHLIGNMLGIAVFATAVCTITGWGAGMLMILLTGVIGNFVNAFMYKSGHLSIGASTAVFGAIGILSGHQFVRKYRQKNQKIRAWLPLASGFALLGILSSGLRVDIMAHLFGFCTGILLGGVYNFYIKKTLSSLYQYSCFLITISIIILAWMKCF